MPNTPNLALPEIEENQDLKEGTHNDAILYLEQAVSEETTVGLNIGSTSVSADTVRRARHVRGVNASSDLFLDFPDGVKRMLSFESDEISCTGLITLRNSPETIAVIPGEVVTFWLDTNKLRRVASNRITLRADYIGTPPINSLISGWLADSSMGAKISANGSRAYAVTAPGASTVLTLQKNGVSAGSITFGTGSNVGTVAMSSNLSMVAGDRLTLHTPANLNGLANLFVALAMVSKS